MADKILTINPAFVRQLAREAGFITGATHGQTEKETNSFIRPVSTLNCEVELTRLAILIGEFVLKNRKFIEYEPPPSSPVTHPNNSPPNT